jgi:NTP pyrophosphohydrolases containing a Zn-finger, probably nucleic-acid-binding
MHTSIKTLISSWVLFYPYGPPRQRLLHAQAFLMVLLPTPKSTTGNSIIHSSSSGRLFDVITSKDQEITSDSDPTWFTDDDLTRSKVPKLDVTVLSSSRFLIAQESEVPCSSSGGRVGKKIIKHWYHQDKDDRAMPLFLIYDDILKVVGSEKNMEWILSSKDVKSSSQEEAGDIQLFWIGERHHVNYFVLYFGYEYFSSKDSTSHVDGIIGPPTRETLSSLCYVPNNQAQQPLGNNNNNNNPHLAPLREFGDKISSPENAAIYSTANGLVEFHRSHKFCSYCGSPTLATKAGSSRICSNHISLSDHNSCRSPTSIYPRIDVASIMLITSPCENYALLGRKKSWPKGRYSTLAGFLEIGETMEQCCVRETLEESGVHVDRSSLRFVKSQPWPFPRSLMTGFRARAKKVSGNEESDDDDDGRHLPVIAFDKEEMEDVRWFHRSYVAKRITEGSTALCYKPMGEEEEFHIPGKSSLARFLILQWVREEEQDATAATITS